MDPWTAIQGQKLGQRRSLKGKNVGQRQEVFFNRLVREIFGLGSYRCLSDISLVAIHRTVCD